jgi:hypothetical protein
MEHQALNRHERRRAEAMGRQNRFVDTYVKHLPEVGPEALGTPGVTYMLCYHEDWCSIYDKANGDLADCNCTPTVKYHQEPKRS